MSEDNRDWVGQQLGNYRLLRLLGRGGFAQVYLGEHVYLKSHAAVKILYTMLKDEEQAVFLQEAQTLVHLNHPHIVRVLDFAIADGTPFLVMEYAPHGTLRTLYPKQTRLPPEVIVPYVQQVASALQYAHDRRLIHRDVKPENLLLGTQGLVLLSDFGLAVLAPHTHSYSTQNMAQQVAGTSLYMAPEQLQGHPLPASDQYALGVVVYEWLCGHTPFEGTPLEVTVQQIAMPPPPLREQLPDLAPAIEEVVLRALVKASEQRFVRIEEFAEALSKACQPPPLHLAPPLSTAQAPLAADQVLQSTRKPEPLWKVPAVFHSLIGREQDVATIGAWLALPEVRELTLLGTGGVGKTSLALEVAAEMRAHFADGVCVVALDPVTDPDLVVPSIAEVCEIRKGGKDGLFAQVKRALRERHLLLVLDNFEQLLEAAPLIEELLLACPSLKIVVTSRAVLHVQGEHQFPVSPLALPDLHHLPQSEALAKSPAVALFVQRARAVLPTFALTQTNARAVAEICVRLDGLPLALELAAARIKLLPPQALLARLSQLWQLLTGGARTLPARRQTLRNTLQWSYDLLGAEEQRLFRRLAVFVGGWTLEAAEAISAHLKESGMSVLDGVASLLDKSLLQLVEQEGEEPRLQMLMTVREYALECLAEAEEMEATRQAHAVYYLAFAEEAKPQLRGAQQLVWLRRLEQEHDNLRAAMQWWLGQAEAREGGQSREMALRLGGALETFWIMRGYFSEGGDFLEKALAAGEGVVASVRAKALRAAAKMAFSLGNYDRAETRCEQSLALYRELGDTAGIASSLRRLGMVAVIKGNLAVGRSRLEEALALRRELGDRDGIAWSLWQLGRVIGFQGEYSRARAVLEEALALFRELGDRDGIAWSHLVLTEVLLDSQDDQAAVQSLLEESLPFFEQMGDRDGITWYFFLSGRLALSQGYVPAARALAEQSLALSRETGNGEPEAFTLVLLAKVVAAQADYPTARALYEESLALSNEMGYQLLIASGSEGLASVLVAQGELVWATRLWATAEARREALGMPMPPVERADYERSVSSARSELGEATFVAAWAEGRTMSLEQALAARGQQLLPNAILAGQPPTPSPKALPTCPDDLTCR